MVPAWLLACPGITNLFAQFYLTPETLGLLAEFTNIQYLTIPVRALAGTTVAHPLFLTITHLELRDWASDSIPVDRVCHNIILIPQLTHIAFNPCLKSRLSHAELCADDRLQCIVFLSRAGVDLCTVLDGSPLLDDSRFVCIEEKIGYRLNWLRGAISGDDY
ncbi:hypothetical protein C8R45DRAFT_1215162 [Mycena sanguinolenta]|nr:hypothetical protein C8R45DRAFT_1215162 [Mycena sanguinolenta]